MASDMDYRGQNLQARSFRAMTLDGADFTGADLRGADFSDASLVDARFTDSPVAVRLDLAPSPPRRSWSVSPPDW